MHSSFPISILGCLTDRNPPHDGGVAPRNVAAPLAMLHPISVNTPARQDEHNPPYFIRVCDSPPLESTATTAKASPECEAPPLYQRDNLTPLDATTDQQFIQWQQRRTGESTRRRTPMAETISFEGRRLMGDFSSVDLATTTQFEGSDISGATFTVTQLQTLSFNCLYVSDQQFIAFTQCNGFGQPMIDPGRLRIVRFTGNEYDHTIIEPQHIDNAAFDDRPIWVPPDHHDQLVQNGVSPNKLLDANGAEVSL